MEEVLVVSVASLATAYSRDALAKTNYSRNSTNIAPAPQGIDSTHLHLIPLPRYSLIAPYALIPPLDQIKLCQADRAHGGKAAVRNDLFLISFQLIGGTKCPILR